MTGKPSAEVVRARAELTYALDAIEDKLNVAKRAREVKARVRLFRRTHPAASAAIMAGAAAAAAATVWCATVVVKKRFF